MNSTFQIYDVKPKCYVAEAEISCGHLFLFIDRLYLGLFSVKKSSLPLYISRVQKQHFSIHCSQDDQEVTSSGSGFFLLSCTLVMRKEYI